MMASTTTQPTVTTKPALPGSNLFWIRAREIFSDPGLPEPRRGAEEVLGESKLGERLAWGVLVLAAGTVLFISLQLYHSWLALQKRRGSIWPFTLTLQAVIAYAYFLPPISGYFVIAGFLAGSVLLLFPERVRWVGFVAVVASWSTLHALVPVHGQPPSDRTALI
ncbi:MAG: hypothetical protein WA580_04955, partial [Acidimicrobiales bacterium]